MYRKIMKNITLIGIDCVDSHRIAETIHYCYRGMRFHKHKILTSFLNAKGGLNSTGCFFDVELIIPIKSISDYNHFVLSKLWKYVDTEYMLIVQHDGYILNPEAWDDDWLNYDYIGAPWSQFNTLKVGNGGFSLRSKRLMKFVADNLYKDYAFYEKSGVNEDNFICRCNYQMLKYNGFKIAPVEVAEKFSIENGIWNGQFGFHGLNTDISKAKI